jgi:hypothetical protein
MSMCVHETPDKLFTNSRATELIGYWCLLSLSAIFLLSHDFQTDMTKCLVQPPTLI